MPAVDPYQLKADVTSLDADLRALRAQKFSAVAVEEIKTWVFTAILGEPCPAATPLLECLKDGTVLCRLANRLSQEDSGSRQIRWKESKMPFVQMEQISQFLDFARGYGVPEDELFQTVDLYEESDPACVYQTLKSLSRYANKKHPDLFPVIGPQIAEKRPRPPVKAKPDSLKSASGWSAQEYGYMGGASQATEHVVFGQRRNIL